MVGLPPLVCRDFWSYSIVLARLVQQQLCFLFELRLGVNCVGFSPTSVVGGGITRFIRAGVSPPNKLVFWGERAQGMS